MKRIIIYSVVMSSLLAFEKSFGQFTELMAGFNLAKIRVTEDGDVYQENQKQKIGYHVSFLYQFPLSKKLAVKTGVAVVSKGLKMEDSESYNDGFNSYSYSYKDVINLNYIEVPVLFKFISPLNDKINAYVTAGPYLGVGFDGVYKSEHTVNGDTETNKEVVDWGNSDEDDLKRLDTGLQFGLGFEYNFVLIELSYSMGLNNIVKIEWDDFKMTNRDLRISVGYKFDKN